MTREEAIQTLTTIDSGYSPNFVANGHIAMGMAIRALEHPEQNVIAVVPCGDTISRQAMHIELEKWITYGEYKYSNATKYLYDRIDRLPSVTPKQRTGHWIFDEILDKHYYCSECKSMGVDYWDYCPNCGARMVEPQESEDKE